MKIDILCLLANITTATDSSLRFLRDYAVYGTCHNPK